MSAVAVSTTVETDLELRWHQEQSDAIQFITPEGELTPLGAQVEINLPLARTLYVDMARARRLDSEALALQRQGELGLWLQCWGQEAAQVGSMHVLRETDFVFPSYREHAAAMVRGVTPSELLSQWRGNSHAGWDPNRYNMHFYSLVLGTQTLHATGYAMGMVLDGGDGLVATYFGDGAASQGDVCEALNWAAARTLPMVFICQNNQWAISTPTKLQYRAPISQRAAGFGLRTFLVDGNDALAMHAVTSSAAALVRNGEGPALVEAITFRMAGHSTSDDPTRYRSKSDLDLWASRDPLTRLRTYLTNAGVESSFFDDLDAELEILGQSVRAACLSIPEPHLDRVFETTYAQAHPVTDAERLAFHAFQESLTDEVSL